MSNDYKGFLRQNPDQTLSKFDYLHRCMKTKEVTNDFLEFFTHLFNPSFIERNGAIFVEENYDADRHAGFIERGVDESKMIVFMNLVEITEYFDFMDFDEAADLANVVCKCWGAKLDAVLPDSGYSAKVMLEDDLGEVYVGLVRN